MNEYRKEVNIMGPQKRGGTQRRDLQGWHSNCVSEETVLVVGLMYNVFLSQHLLSTYCVLNTGLGLGDDGEQQHHADHSGLR